MKELLEDSRIIKNIIKRELLNKGILEFQLNDYKISVIIIPPNSLHYTYITKIELGYGKAKICEKLYDYFNPNSVFFINVCKMAIEHLFECIEDCKEEV